MAIPRVACVGKMHFIRAFDLEYLANAVVYSIIDSLIEEFIGVVQTISIMEGQMQYAFAAGSCETRGALVNLNICQYVFQNWDCRGSLTFLDAMVSTSMALLGIVLISMFRDREERCFGRLFPLRKLSFMSF